MDTIILRRVGG